MGGGRRVGSAPGATTRWICAGCDDAVDLRRVRRRGGSAPRV